METSPYPLDQWYWYVDDSEIKCKEDQSDEIVSHLTIFNHIWFAEIYSIDQWRNATPGGPGKNMKRPHSTTMLKRFFTDKQFSSGL